VKRIKRLFVQCSPVVSIIASLVISNPTLAQTMPSNRVESKSTSQANTSVEVLHSDTTTTLKNPGKDSIQLLWYKNSPEAKITITRVTMQPKAISERHKHPRSEQEWVVESGEGTLLLDHDETRPIRAGDVVRTPAGNVHGVLNSGDTPLVYISVTTPPEDFGQFYSDSEKNK